MLTDFVDHLVAQVQNSALHDGYFLETLVLWLIQLCSSSLRQLRHTATFAGWQLSMCVRTYITIPSVGCLVEHHVCVRQVCVFI